IRTSKVNIPPARPQPVPTGKPKVFAPVHASRQNRPFPIPTDRGYSPSGNLASLVAHASVDESMKWHRRMGHVNYKNMNRLVKGDLVRGLPPKLFKNDHTRIACYKGKQHKASYKAINVVSSIYVPLQLLHMDLFGPTSIQSIDHKYYCLVITDDYSRVLITSPHNKTPYALLTGNIPFVNHFKPFGCHVTILNTSDYLGKFDGKANEGCIVGYSVSNKAYKVYNVPNKRVEETMNLRFLEDKLNVQGLGHEWYFDIDYLTDTLGYKHVQANQSARTQGAITNSVDTTGDKVDDSPLNSADEIYQKELARLKGQEQKATSDAESLGLSNTVVSIDDVPVPSSRTNASFFDDKPTTRFPCPSDLGNHDPLPGIFSSSSYDDEFGVALNNVASIVEVSPVATTRINTIHPQSLIMGDPTSAVQTRSKNVWVLIDLPEGKYAIGTKWILKNKRDAREIIVRNKARLVAQGHRQEEGIDYDEVFAPDAKIEAIRLLLAFSFYMGFMVYQMDVRSAFLYGRIDEEVYVTQPKGFVDPQHPKKVYKVQQRPNGIFINQDKYVQEILNKFDLGSVKTTTTPYEVPKPKSKNESNSPVNVHLYRSMIGSLMYLTASRPDIMFTVSACSRNQVTPTTSNLEAVKKIFMYLKGQPKLGLWYPRESPLVLEAYSDSDYAGANKDRKSTTGRCQFLGMMLISWQCKKQTIMATSSTEAEYVAAANCCVSTLHCDQQPAQNLNPTSTSSIATLRYRDEHNKVGYLLKPTGSDDYHQIIDLWRASHIRSPELGLPAIQATIDKTTTPLPRTYPIVVALICLSDGRRFNSSSYIFKGMVSNIGNAKNFLLYPRILQAILGIETRIKRKYKVLMFSSKLFANMRLHFEGHPMPLLPAMLLQAQAGEDGEFRAILIPSLDLMRLMMALSPMWMMHPWKAHFICLLQGPLKLPLHKVNSLETELKDHKQLFKDVVGKLVLKVKAMEVKLKTKKMKLVVSDSDQEDGRQQDVDLDALRALANAAMIVDSNIPPGGASSNPAASTSVPAASTSVPATVPSGASTVPIGASTVPSGTLTVPTGSPSVLADVPPSVTPASVSNKGKSPMVAEDIPVKARTFKQMEEDRLEEFEKIRKVQLNSQIQAFSRTLKRTCPVLEEPSSKRQKSTEAPIPSVLEVPKSPAVSSPPSSGTRKKTLGRKRLTKPKSTLQESYLDADAQTFIKVISTEDSDDEAPLVWSDLVGWEVISTPLGDINALYRIDQSTKHFTTLRQILYMVDRHDLVKLYGLVVKFYETHPVAGVGLILWGDLQVLFDSYEGGKGSCVWQHQHLWEIRSWRLYTLSNVHILETVFGKVFYMFANVSYPLFEKLMEKMLRHKLD
nr:ribonuclease H-like domain-containing protein [Tanacetum cinerariifolium]